jgi:hypothetical protein
MTPTVALLNRLLTIHCRSLPVYLAEAGAWWTAPTADDEIARTLRAIVFDQQATAARIADVILRRHGTIHVGSFSMEFTDKNDLALDFLVGEAAERARRDVSAIEQILAALPPDDDAARELTQEALGAAKAHAEDLEAAAAKQPA